MAIEVLGARVHNLKNIDVTIPGHSLAVVTGLSGSGKSSLAFDTIYAEGQRRYIETFSSYARNFLGNLERPDVDKISGLSPVRGITLRPSRTACTPSRPSSTRTGMCSSADTTTGRAFSVCGQIGVSTKQSRPGSITGPPADNE